VNVQERLLWLLPKVDNVALKMDIEDVLKESVSKHEYIEDYLTFLFFEGNL
jgi:hypothetical protein